MGAQRGGFSLVPSGIRCMLLRVPQRQPPRWAGAAQGRRIPVRRLAASGQFARLLDSTTVPAEWGVVAYPPKIQRIALTHMGSQLEFRADARYLRAIRVCAPIKS